MRKLALALLLAVIGWGGGTTSAAAEGLPDASCTGTLNGYFASVTVPAGASCTLNLATIQHNVVVSAGASLTIVGQSKSTPAIAVTIGGSIKAKGCSFVSLDGSLGGIAVRKDVNISGCTQTSGFTGPGVMIGGNFLCSNNKAACIADNGTVVGTVSLSNNTSSTPSDVSGNVIGRDLTCSGNAPAPGNMGAANYVAQTAWVQCGASFVSSTPPANCSTALNLAEVPNVSLYYVQDVPAANGNPEYCQVVGSLETQPEPGAAADGWKSSAGFLLRLPAQWNSRFVFMGCGGSCGSIGTMNFQTGIVTPSLSVNTFDSGEVLSLGFAVVNTDTGHEAIAGSNLQPWALVDVGMPNKGALYDNAYRSVHEITIAAKQLVEAYYDGHINYAYFDGCSTGGRQGMVEASHYPEDYDGVIAGSPVFDADTISASNDKGFAVWLAPGAFISSSTIASLDSAVLTNCDALDGVADGLIQNPQACTLDPNALVGSVLTQPQAQALKYYLSQVYDTLGRSVYPGAPLGHWATTGVSSYINFNNAPAPHPTSPQPWSQTGAQITSSTVPGPVLFTLSDPGIRYQKEQDQNFDTINQWPEQGNVILADELVKMKQRVGRGNGDDPKKLQTFLSENRKLIMTHGFADHLATPYRTVWYYRELAAQAGGYSQLQQNVRLFMVPGMGHCGGGTSPNTFDTLQTLVNWVENGTAPDGLPATNASTNTAMPLCKFPEEAAYLGGPTNQASSWTCSSSDHRLNDAPGYAGLLAGMNHTDQLPGH